MNLRMTLIGSLLLVIHLPSVFAWQGEKKVPKDSRLSKHRNIYDKLHPRVRHTRPWHLDRRSHTSPQRNRGPP